jgi:hypothetical protein
MEADAEVRVTTSEVVGDADPGAVTKPESVARPVDEAVTTTVTDEATRVSEPMLSVATALLPLVVDTMTVVWASAEDFESWVAVAEFESSLLVCAGIPIVLAIDFPTDAISEVR